MALRRRRIAEPGRRGGGRGRRLLWILAVLAVIAAVVMTFRTGGAPEVAIQPEVEAIGKATSVTFSAAEPSRGVARIRVSLVQGERVEALLDESYATRPAWAFWGERQARVERTLEVGSGTLPNLESGKATLRIEAWPAFTWLRHSAPAVSEITLPVQLTPPSLAVLSRFHFVEQGGSELVVYRVGESAVRSGVQAGEWFFPGYPLPASDPQRRFALFSAPWNLATAESIRLVAVDAVGNRGSTAFIDRFTPNPPSHDTIVLSKAFFAKVVPEIMSHTPGLEDRGSLLENYLQLNGALRQRNAERLVELASESVAGLTWDEAFVQMPDSQVMSTFADRRAYMFEGRKVDEQTHLGFDLATVEHDPIPAANRGRVLMAHYFGIYGNAVLLDHGSGLMSLYGHLSSFAVKEGELVERGEILGRTGDTGLAGGDHLHFTMLVQGLPVTPVEWWDPHWIQDRIARKLEGQWPETGARTHHPSPQSSPQRGEEAR